MDVPAGTPDTREPVLFRGHESDPTTLSEVLGQAVGAASTCWESMEGTGVFQSDRASKIVDEEMAWIKANGYEQSELLDIALAEATELAIKNDGEYGSSEPWGYKIDGVRYDPQHQLV